jgi:hypothetical protein
MSPTEEIYEELLYLVQPKITGTYYMSDVEDCPEEEEPLFSDWSLEILCNMDDPPGEAYETSWRRAKDLLANAGPSSAILLLTIQEEPDGNLGSSVVLSSGEQRIPTNVIMTILETHLESLIGEEGQE